MPTYRVKLKEGAFDEAQKHDTGVSIFETQERHDQRVDEDGYVTLRKREFDRLRQLGLIEDSETDPVAEAPAPEEDTNTRTRTLTQRRPGRATAVHPGGVGHQPNDNYSNAQVQREIKRQEEQGLRQRQERGLPPEQDSVLEASRRSDGHLPEQVKEHERLTREHEESVEKARKEAAKDREKDRKEQERQAEKDQREQEKARQQRAKDLQTGEVTQDQDVSRNQGAGLSEDQNRDARGDRSEAKANEKSRAGSANKAGAEKDKG